MRVARMVATSGLRVPLVIGACFLLASTCWIGWLYHLMDLLPSGAVDAIALVGGYAMQALGAGMYLLLGRRLPWQRMRRLTLACVGVGLLCLAPSVLSSDLLAVLSFGLVHNVAWGFVGGFYLHLLAARTSAGGAPLAFGGAYAATTICSWALSVPGGGTLLRGMPCMATCGVLALAAGTLVATCEDAPEDVPPEGEDGGLVSCTEHDKTMTYALACAVVILASMVKNAGYSFPTADLAAGVSLEASRLLYGVGLVAAGFVNRRGRNLGALCCMSALVLPFLTLALVGTGVTGALLWSIDYLLFGFYALYRVVVWVDLAQATRRPHVAGLGLLLGRVGDSVGSGVSMALSGYGLLLVCVVAVLFALTSASFFLLYQRLYFPVADAQSSERERFELFAARHDLSAREREVLRLLLEERTNTQIAQELFVSSSTVKFHVRNLLRKTGCANRRQLLATFYGGRD